MLPYISHDIEEIFSFEHVHRTRRQPILQINVSHGLILPLRLVLFHQTSQRIVLILCWQSCVSTRFLCFPLTKCTGLKVVNLNWPIPRHSNFTKNSSQLKEISSSDPEKRMLLLDRFQPIFPLLSPPLIVLVPSIFNKAQVLPIGNQHGTSFKFTHIKLPFPKLVVPTIHIHIFN